MEALNRGLLGKRYVRGSTGKVSLREHRWMDGSIPLYVLVPGIIMIEGNIWAAFTCI